MKNNYNRLNIVFTNIPYEFVLQYAETYKVEKKISMGEIININGCEYISLENEDEGNYIRLYPIVFIDILESESKLEINGFIRRKSEVEMYKIKSFDSYLEPTLGEFSNISTTYRYYRDK